MSGGGRAKVKQRPDEVPGTVTIAITPDHSTTKTTHADLQEVRIYLPGATDWLHLKAGTIDVANIATGFTCKLTDKASVIDCAVSYPSVDSTGLTSAYYPSYPFCCSTALSGAIVTAKDKNNKDYYIGGTQSTISMMWNGRSWTKTYTIKLTNCPLPAKVMALTGWPKKFNYNRYCDKVTLKITKDGTTYLNATKTIGAKGIGIQGINNAGVMAASTYNQDNPVNKPLY